MDFLRPSTWDEALAAKAEFPDAVPIAGGTDVMVELNFDRRRPPALLDLTRVADRDPGDAHHELEHVLERGVATRLAGGLSAGEQR